jgi:plasmid stabilization system protein ParE
LRRLVYLSSAQQDFRNILRYITVESADRALARAFVDRLQQQCRKLASLPGRTAIGIFRASLPTIEAAA